MTIREDGVSAVCVGKLLAQNLQIPHYQRPYSWEPITALQLLDDINDALGRGDRQYVLGAVILHANDEKLDVVDGQQRLLTLRMIIASLDSKDGLKIRPNADNPVSRVWSALHRRIRNWSSEKKQNFLKYVRDCCQVVRVVTDDVDEAFRVFDSQNYRGKPLAPHDLLKAHHLREMTDESDAMKTAIVETWESVKDDDLDQLFSIYLYRIARWTRGESAPGFTTRDIDMFKGITRAISSPGTRYHRAAQTALPMLNSWQTQATENGDRDSGRSRFQLDMPLVAGRPFFEMVSFMLAELGSLRLSAFPDTWKPFASFNWETFEERPSRSRYRKVSELYLAAILYYTNRFGDEDIAAARECLFAWAYSVRVKLLQVQHPSIDNFGRGKDRASAFELLRNAHSGRVVYQLIAPLETREDHESDLVELLKKLGLDEHQ